jgi:hypothetical protein
MPALTLACLPFHAAELPLPPGSQAIFVLKRRHRLCVTEAAEVDGGGGVEWDTRCTQASQQLRHRFPTQRCVTLCIVYNYYTKVVGMKYATSRSHTCR